MNGYTHLILTLTGDLSCYILNVIAKIKNKIEKNKDPKPGSYHMEGSDDII